MTMMTLSTLSTAQATRGKTAHSCTTVLAGVWVCGGNIEADCNSDVVSSILRPREEIGRVPNRTPNSCAEATKRQDLAIAILGTQYPSNDRHIARLLAI